VAIKTVIHAVLLGDSIFDNASYVPQGLPVQGHLTRALATLGTGPHQVSLLAVDGNYIEDVHDQIEALPETATHLFLSVGGNDALRYASQLQQQASSFPAALTALAAMKTEFNRRYGHLLDTLMQCDRPLTVCTIYDQAPTADPALRLLAVTALPLFNDCITRLAIQRGLALIDLRLVCSDPEDYSARSPIEPSDQGGQKIVQVIAQVLAQAIASHPDETQRTIGYA
jgi:hypothetical protein